MMLQYYDCQEQECTVDDAAISGCVPCSDQPKGFRDSDEWKENRPMRSEIANAGRWQREASHKGRYRGRGDWRQINTLSRARLNDFMQQARRLAGVENEDFQVVVTDQAVDKAIEFVKDVLRHAIEKYDYQIDIPEALPGPHQSVDIFWKFPRYELLVNVPTNATDPLTYYGDDRGDSMVKGSISSPREVGAVCLWLRLIGENQ